MKFRYFVITGKSLNSYLESEKKELDQRDRQVNVLLKERDDIESFLPSHTGKVLALVFKSGKQPEGMVVFDKKNLRNGVRPHAKLPVAKPFRDLLESIKVTENSQEKILQLLGLPTHVVGAHEGSRIGLAMFTSRVGHVGTNLIAEVPTSEDKDAVIKKDFETHPDLKEIAMWEYVKMHEDFKDYDNGRAYILTLRD